MFRSVTTKSNEADERRTSSIAAAILAGTAIAGALQRASDEEDERLFIVDVENVLLRTACVCAEHRLEASLGPLRRPEDR